MGSRPLFRARPALMVRSVLLHDLPIPPAPDLSRATPAATESWRRWVLEVWDIQEIAAAVRHASADLSREISNLHHAAPGPDALRRTVLTLLGYVLRLTHRVTPFGLYARITDGGFGATTSVRWGHKHRTLTRAGGAWFAAVVEQLEAVPEVRRKLRLCANNALRVRGERLVLPWQPRALEETGTAVREVSVRHTATVRTVIQLAQTPVPYRDVVSKLDADHPGLGTSGAEELLDLLITRRMLLTSLQPSGTVTDALGYVVHELDRVGAMGSGPAADLAVALREVHAQMRDLDRADLSQETDRQRTALVTRMRQIADHPSPLAMDARLDADLTLPRVVAWEAEAAARVLARVTPEPRGTQAWLRYRERFTDRYGEGTLIPLTDLLDPHSGSGLGLPEDFHGTARAPKHGARHRDRLLTTLAQRAWAEGQDLALDEDLIQQLTAGQAPTAAQDVPAHVELVASVHAASVQQLDAGDFSLAVRRTGRGWGHFSGGRLAALLAEDASPSELLGTLAHRPTTVRGALPVQVSFPSLMAKAGYITRTPRLVALISLSEYQPADPDLIPPNDLAVTCHQGRLHLVSLSRERVLEAAIPHPLQLECQTPTVARFVDELQRGQSSRLIGSIGNLDAWDWGAAADLAFLPRVRAGRSILSPATWRLAHSSLPGANASTAQWDESFAALRERWRLPRRVYVARFDYRLRLDLEHPAHRALLRSQMDRLRFGELTLTEAEPDHAYDWCGGRAHEVVVCLASTAPARPAPVLRGAPIVRRDHTHLPGASRYLSVRLHCQPQVRRALLTDHLPSLAAELPHCVWWITAHDEGGQPQTELTIRLPRLADAADAMRLVGPWAEHLTDGGVVSDIAFVPYRPHVGLWGGGRSPHGGGESMVCRHSGHHPPACPTARLGLPARTRGSERHRDHRRLPPGRHQGDEMAGRAAQAGHHHVTSPPAGAAGPDARLPTRQLGRTTPHPGGTRPRRRPLGAPVRSPDRLPRNPAHLPRRPRRRTARAAGRPSASHR
ncbi:lantibiotic dehydratase [Streptomyces sp. NPDC059118]|uniref:lantibiotic dehydratase n=1 Tax=unclassified Streptomyces TaxID=2593676 RepID=UPI0036BCDE48